MPPSSGRPGRRCRSPLRAAARLSWGCAPALTLTVLWQAKADPAYLAAKTQHAAACKAAKQAAATCGDVEAGIVPAAAACRKGSSAAPGPARAPNSSRRKQPAAGGAVQERSERRQAAQQAAAGAPKAGMQTRSQRSGLQEL